MKSSHPYVLPEAREEIIDLVLEGRDISAVKLVRKVTGVGLKQAKDYVDGLKGEAYARVVAPAVQAGARALIAEGNWIAATKLVRSESGLHLKAAKDFVDAVREGRVPAPPPPAGGRGLLSDRVRAFRHAGDHESAVALVCAETGMDRDEAQRFVEALR